MKTTLIRTLAIIFGLFVALGDSVSAAKLKSDDLSNMVIEGENRLTVRAVSHKTDWTPDPHRNINDEFRGDQLANAFVPPSTTKPPLAFATVIRSKKTASPWHTGFYEPPLLTINVKPGDKDRKINWVFLVKNSQSEIVYEMKKSGPIPETIHWQGFDKKNLPLQVGSDYSYSLSIIDEAGNPKRFSGDSFRVSAFRFEKGGKLNHFLDAEAIFDSKSTVKFSKGGTRLLTEVKDGVRTRYNKTVTVVTYEDDEKFAMARSNAIRRFLIEQLDLPEEKVIAQSGPKNAPQGYRHVEILVH